MAHNPAVIGAEAKGDLEALASCPEWTVLINNADIARVKQSILDINHDDWNDIFSVNLRSALLLSQAIVPQMIKTGNGKVVNMSSIGAFIGTPGPGAYAAPKATLNQQKWPMGP